MFSKYGNTYNEKNVIISSTHSHSTPGGWTMYLLYDLPSSGFVKESYNNLVEGITQVKFIVVNFKNYIV